MNQSSAQEDAGGALPLPMDKYTVSCAYMMTALIIIGLLGIVSNSFALAVVLSVKKTKDHQKKKSQISTFIQSQTWVDLVTSLVLVLTYSTKISGVFVEGFWGDLFCRLLYSESLLWISSVASTFNLVCLSFERYLMIVFPIAHREHFTPCKTWGLIAGAWILAFCLNACLFLVYASRDGSCRCAEGLMGSVHAQMAYGYLHLLAMYFLPLIMLVYFYAHMLAVIQKKVKHREIKSDPTQDANRRHPLTHAQINLVKTLCLVSTLFVVCWSPSRLYCFLFGIRKLVGIPFEKPFADPVYKVSLSLTMFNTCVNPFLYACKYEDFKKDAKALMARCGQPLTRIANKRTLEHGTPPPYECTFRTAMKTEEEDTGTCNTSSL